MRRVATSPGVVPMFFDEIVELVDLAKFADGAHAIYLSARKFPQRLARLQRLDHAQQATTCSGDCKVGRDQMLAAAINDTAIFSFNAHGLLNAEILFVNALNTIEIQSVLSVAVDQVIIIHVRGRQPGVNAAPLF